MRLWSGQRCGYKRSSIEMLSRTAEELNPTETMLAGPRLHQQSVDNVVAGVPNPCHDGVPKPLPGVDNDRLRPGVDGSVALEAADALFDDGLTDSQVMPVTRSSYVAIG
ncbi:hypothetical protein [Halolamina salifodinae]|uniref:Uncharacterized protein n=1 Tax=Halolamina salifodinae TaxID=1202767 RepID=A0A8T4GT55_9EURY|nr:hypothetical protein [Halolamina salifodinae]MBP1986187.1 hypothetical protein [Halolamina salifodinae]